MVTTTVILLGALAGALAGYLSTRVDPKIQLTRTEFIDLIRRLHRP